ncbi:MAG: multifunctional oxoglutarate decarboxylase/oxoglutarate dehydrogenase thiamine pyrophosphate-binding subunit/dihydrolipoyllysine-residue succinyltransferase subunit, partial [Acidimicrobiales bacterium]
DNIQVAQPTTSAQYFHLLRRQVHQPDRRPLVVLTPKWLLRAHESRSSVDDLTHGSFQVVLDDPASPLSATRLILASGKIAFDAMAARDARGAAVPVARVEQLYPWPEDEILRLLDRYPAVRDVVWLQEEPENMGPWPFVHVRLHRVLRDRAELRHVSRAASASPATGSQTIHAREQADLMERVLSGG